jgi:hypothetical protein
VPGYEASTWYGIGAPKNTPAEVVKLNKEMNAAFADPKMKPGSPICRFRLARRLRQTHRRRDCKVGQGPEVLGCQTRLTRGLHRYSKTSRSANLATHVCKGSIPSKKDFCGVGQQH